MKKLLVSFGNGFRRHAATITTGAMLAGASLARATDSPPLDLSAAGTTLAGYVAVAAAGGLGVAVAIWGVRVIIRAFKSVVSK